MIVVRKFKPVDLGKVYEIEQQSFKDPYNALLLLNLYELFPEGFFVAEEDGIIVGYAISRIVGEVGHILAIAVDPKYRGRRIGKVLMGAVTNYFLSKGVVETWLEVRASNQLARRFYRSLGFVERKTIPQYYSDGESAVILKKRLRVV